MSCFGGRRSRARLPKLALLPGMMALVLLSGCTNNLLKQAQSLTNSITNGNPLAGVTDGNGNTSGLSLASVQLDTFNPKTTLDLIGDGSGTLGQVCQPASSSGSGSGGSGGKSTCTCAYSYLQSNGVQIGPVEVDTSYSELNMIRCPYTVVPQGVPYISVYIHIIGPDTRTNSITLNLNGSSSGGLDYSNPLSFSKVGRYQCRDIVYVPYLWDHGIYDPFVSEDPKFSYPLNFYTTNMGLTFAEYTADTNAKGWNCPALPNDTAAGMDLTLYSVTADTSGNKMIFPPGGNFDRSTFYVANAQGGPFTVPVNAYVYPGAVSAAAAPTGGLGGAAAGAGSANQPPPLGYAANPIPIQGGGETCPDASVPIPAGFHWAKLWLFRKQLPQRAYNFSNALAQFGGGQDGIACNSPAWQSTPVPAPPHERLFTDCSQQYDWNNLDPTYHLASRFASNVGQCYNIKPGGATNPATGLNWPLGSGPNASVDYTVYSPGTDVWSPTMRDPTNGCNGTQTNDVSHACQSASGNVPYDNGQTTPFSLGLIDPSTASPRYDFLFVVSPTSVNRDDMVITNSSSTHSIYTPVRFMSPTDCKSSDPDQPTGPGDCSPSRMLTYQITVSQAGNPGQTGQQDPDAPGDFPMCVLQPN